MRQKSFSCVDDNLEAAVRETLHIKWHWLILPLRVVLIKLLHHNFIYFVTMRAGFVDDKGEPHRLPALALGHLGERLRLRAACAGRHVVTRALLVVQSAVFAPYFDRRRRHLFVCGEVLLGNYEHETVYVCHMYIFSAHAS